MLVSVLLGSALAFLRPAPDASLATIQSLAEKRDSAGLEEISGPETKGKFAFLKGQGAYGVGRYGWKAELLPEAKGDKQYIVFSTPLTTEDRGDQVFVYDGSKITKLVHERETLGVRITRLDMSLSFNMPQKTATIVSDTTFRQEGKVGTSFLVRLGDNYTVSSVTDENGNSVAYHQADGVVSLAYPGRGQFKYRLTYSGTVDRPRYGGAITDNEVMMTNDMWWPSIARLPVPFTTKTRVPTGMTVVAQGDLVSKTSEGNQDVWTYDMKVPVCYLSLSAGNFRSAELEKDGKTFYCWSSSLTDEQLKEQTELVAPVIRYYSTISPLPFKSYGQLVTPLYGGGALEAYSYATYGTGWLPDEDAHEPAHTWFGGILPCTYLETFWNESFADFCDGMYQREGDIGSVEDKRRAFVSVQSTPGTYRQAPILGTGADAGGVASSLGYGKGAGVLQQLEYEMGHDAMIAAMKKWIAEHKPGTATDWADFMAACGPQWSGFFRQWLTRTGWPVMTIKNVRYLGGSVSADVTFEGDPYDLAVEVMARVNGKDTYQKVWIKPDATKTAHVSFKADAKPELVSFDPFDRLMGPSKPAVDDRWEVARRRMTVYVSDAAKEWWSGGRTKPLTEAPTDGSGAILVAKPGSNKVLDKMLGIAGVKVTGSKATFKGTTVDLDHGAVVGIVQVGPEKWGGFKIGKSMRDPHVGLASIAVTDDYGRFLRGETRPRTTGPMVFRL